MYLIPETPGYTFPVLHAQFIRRFARDFPSVEIYFVMPMGRYSPHLWQFGESVGADRARQMLGYSSSDQVIALLSTAENVAFAWEPFQSERLNECNRAAFLLQVSIEAYDAFFNSPVGYRAQYAVSIGTGEAASRALLSRLELQLPIFASAMNPVSDVRVQASLRGADAKVWIYESEVAMQLGRAVRSDVILSRQTSIEYRIESVKL